VTKFPQCNAVITSLVNSSYWLEAQSTDIAGHAHEPRANAVIIRLGRYIGYVADNRFELERASSYDASVDE